MTNIKITLPSDLEELVYKAERKNNIRVFVCAVLFMLCAYFLYLNVETYIGRVEKATVKTTYSGTGGKYNNFVNTIYLTIMTPDGKKLHKKVYSPNANQKQSYSLYQIGDTVFHLYGTKSVVVLPRKKDTHFECAVCEDVNEIENTVCRSCGHTLIKSEDSLFAARDNSGEFTKIQY